MFSASTEERNDFCKPEAQSRAELQGRVLWVPRDGGTMEPAAETCASWDTASPSLETSSGGHLSGCRADGSLVLLTRKFAEIFERSTDKVLDLNLVALELNVSKRRLYDVTNVLEGIKVVKKTRKNHIQWVGGRSEDKVTRSLNALIKEEQKLDELIQQSARQISELCGDDLNQRYSYLTYEEIKSIPSLAGQTAIVIKAPAGTQLHVSHPEESFQIHLKSFTGPIDALLYSDALVPMETTETPVAGSASIRRFQLPSHVKHFFSSLPPFLSMQASSGEGAKNSSELKGASNPASEGKQRPTLLTLVPLTKLCNITQKPGHSYAVSSPISSVGGDYYLIRLGKGEGIAKNSSA